MRDFGWESVRFPRGMVFLSGVAGDDIDASLCFSAVFGEETDGFRRRNEFFPPADAPAETVYRTWSRFSMAGAFDAAIEYRRRELRTGCPECELTIRGELNRQGSSRRVPVLSQRLRIGRKRSPTVGSSGFPLRPVILSTLKKRSFPHLRGTLRAEFLSTSRLNTLAIPQIRGG